MSSSSTERLSVSRLVSRILAGAIAVAGLSLAGWVQQGWRAEEGLFSLNSLLMVAFAGGPIFMLAGLMAWLGRSILSKLLILAAAIACILFSIETYAPGSSDGQAALVFVFVPLILCVSVIVVGVVVGVLEATFRSWSRWREAKAMGESVASQAAVKSNRAQFWLRLVVLLLLISLLSWLAFSNWDRLAG